jgi:hypothetical protein
LRTFDFSLTAGILHGSETMWGGEKNTGMYWLLTGKSHRAQKTDEVMQKTAQFYRKFEDLLVDIRQNNYRQ